MDQIRSQIDAKPLTVPLDQLGLAPENLRFAEPPDDDVPRLADTIAAAGLIYPLLVRPGRDGEAPFAVLDGRRRRYALLLRVERGELAPDAPVNCLLVEGRGRQAAAAVLPNREHAPMHPADVIAAIGRLRTAKMNTAAIAAALGYDAAEVRRLMALSRVHPDALQAFRDHKLSLKHLCLVARLTNADRQAEFAAMARDGYFPAWQLEAAVRGDRITVEDARFRLVGAAYAQAGGRLDGDLFGELPDVVVDAELLERIWRERAIAVGQAMMEGGLVLHLGAEHEWRAPEGLETLRWCVPANLSAAQQGALVAAEAEVQMAAAQLHALADLGAGDTELTAYLAARLGLARARRPDDDIAAVLLTPDRDHGLEIAVLCRPASSAPPADDEEAADEDPSPGAPVRSDRPDVIEPELVVEVAGVSNALHEARTDMATRGLIRALAEEPQAALVVLTAHLFKLLALHGAGGRDESALSVTASPYSRSSAAAVKALDGEVRRRLAERRTSYLESGLRPIDWVSGLDAGERLTLLAELTALSLDLREVRTTALRRAARAEAREIAALCGGELSTWWTPDADFLKRYGKPQLLAMLVDMGAAHAPADKLRKHDLATKVAAEAAARRWIPPELRMCAAVSIDPPDETDGQQRLDGASGCGDAALAAAS